VEFAGAGGGGVNTLKYNREEEIGEPTASLAFNSQLGGGRGSLCRPHLVHFLRIQKGGAFNKSGTGGKRHFYTVAKR